MKTKILEILIVLVIIALICGMVRVQLAPPTVEVIDGCQYLKKWTGHGYSLTHKGNCTNEFHKIQK